jgi:hypothetical protein
VTRRHIAFLFESYPDHLKRPKPSNEETVMYARTEVRELAEGDWQLPPTDDSHVGEELE